MSERAEVFYRELDRQQQTYARRRRRDKRKAFGLQMATVSLSATVTVLLGVKVTPHIGAVLSNVALTLTALTTVLAAADAFFRHRALWVNRTATVRRLEALRRLAGVRLAGHDAGSDLPGGVAEDLLWRLQAILDDDHRAWLQLRSVEDATLTPTDRGADRGEAL